MAAMLPEPVFTSVVGVVVVVAAGVLVGEAGVDGVDGVVGGGVTVGGLFSVNVTVFMQAGPSDVLSWPLTSK
jgi:hypothetical protein